MLTILSVFGLVMIVLVAADILPVYFLVPAAGLIGVVAGTEVRPILAERRLARSGEVVAGIVTALVPQKRIRKHNFESKWTVQYRYSWAGARHEGSSRPLPYGVIEGMSVGDPIALHVDRSRPEISAWVAGG